MIQPSLLRRSAEATKGTKDTKKKQGICGCAPPTITLFFVSFVCLRVLRVNWPHNARLANRAQPHGATIDGYTASNRA
jgi:hypothetical protein